MRTGRQRQHNRYEKYDDNTMIGYTYKNEPFFVDTEDYSLVYPYSWHRHQDGYMRTCDYGYIGEDGKRHNHYIMMHQLLHNQYHPDSDLVFDHIDGDGANNRKSNLREVSQKTNMKNLKMYANNTSGHTGVYYNKLEKKWKARITVDNIKINLGTYATFEEAVIAREEAEKQYYPEYRRKTS